MGYAAFLSLRRHNTARIAVARKLAIILHRMWVDVTEFRCGKGPAHGRHEMRKKREEQETQHRPQG